MPVANSLTGLQRAAVLAAIQNQRDQDESPIIKAALVAQLARADEGASTVLWRVKAGRVSIEVDELVSDGAATDVLQRFQGQLINLLKDRLVNR